MDDKTPHDFYVAWTLSPDSIVLSEIFESEITADIKETSKSVVSLSRRLSYARLGPLA
jgi:hypothetical protein